MTDLTRRIQAAAMPINDMPQPHQIGFEPRAIVLIKDGDVFELHNLIAISGRDDYEAEFNSARNQISPRPMSGIGEISIGESISGAEITKTIKGEQFPLRMFELDESARYIVLRNGHDTLAQFAALLMSLAQPSKPQPIDTAPRDGTSILVSNDRGLTQVEWCDPSTHDVPFDGWFIDGMKAGYFMLRGSEPTEWLNLP